MRIRVALFLLLSSVFLANVPLPASDLALVGAKIYLSPTDPPIEDGSILIRDGLISTVGPRTTVKIPRDTHVIDCKVWS